MPHPDDGWQDFTDQGESDSVEARDSIEKIVMYTLDQHHLIWWDDNPQGAYRCSCSPDTDRNPPAAMLHQTLKVLAALSEHGFSVIRTDPETKERAVVAMQTYRPSSNSRVTNKTLLEAALVVLRGDPPQPRHLTNSAGGHHNPRDQAILGGDPSL